MTKYAPEQFRKVLKAEQHDYIQRAIEIARTAPAAYEGSLDPTGSTIFQFRTFEEALEAYSDLKSDGWKLQQNSSQCFSTLFSFVAFKPNHVFELDIPQIALRAEKAYLKEVADHNKEAQRLKDRAEHVEREFARRNEVLRAELEKEYDNRGRSHTR
ncbi:hypothetical protein QEL93_002185 [Pseudomonas putida]|nr:hypothetical protein [Pseudomonas putida]